MADLMDLQTLKEIEQFLYREARLLDDGQYEDWLDLFTDDAHYWMPSREGRANRQDGILGPEALPLMDDDKAFMKARVARLRSGFAHAEEPESRTRRFISNIEVLSGDKASSLEVQSNVLLFQSRLEKTEKFYVGKRIDQIMVIDGDYKISRRQIILDHILLPRSLSVFF